MQVPIFYDKDGGAGEFQSFHTNRLIHEKSPYLLHHAMQSIDWYPWGEEAFVKAQKEGKPIFLSIGYSTCHWCHVMSKESFEDHMVAQYLNENFVSIKVDREERPDVDAIYMKIAQVMTGEGGWPLNLFLTPEGKPFYAMTYVPKRRHHGRPGFLEILPEMARLWKEDRARLESSADQLYNFMDENLFAYASGEAFHPAIFDETYELFLKEYDHEYGGFGGAPKFPAVQNLLYLLAYGHYGDPAAHDLVKRQLTQMVRGGIYDHVGGGFCRYAVDEAWRIPHFEKTLYDNALLMYTYASAYHYMREPLFLEVAKEIGDYLLREMQSPEGGFYSGQDADVDGEEGKFYLFYQDELKTLLGKDAPAFFHRYHITREGDINGGNVLYLTEEASARPDAAMRALLDRVYEYRQKRHYLYVDDKQLTGWNGLAMAAFGKLWQVSGEEAYLEAAKGAHRFILRYLKGPDGRLAVRYRGGHRLDGGLLDDYAYYAWGLYTLHQVTFQVEYLVEFREIMDQAIRHFFDGAHGGFYMVPDDGEKLIFHPKETMDAALPSGNSVMLWLLQKLLSLTGDFQYDDILRRQSEFMTAQAKAVPLAHAFGLRSLLNYEKAGKELVVTTTDFTELDELREFMWTHPHPNMTVLVKTEANSALLAKVAPFTQPYPIMTSGAQHFYYLCESWRCHDATTSIGVIDELFRAQK